MKRTFLFSNKSFISFFYCLDLTIPKEKGPSPKLLTESELEIYCELMLVYGDDYKVSNSF